MFEKIPREHRKKFIVNSFIYMPLGLILSLLFLTMLAKFVEIEIDLGLIICVLLSLILSSIFSVWNLCRKLTKKKP